MKVLMICDFSVDEVRQHLDIDNNSILIRILSMLNKPTKVVDHGLWNYYAIKEFEAYKDVELTVLSFHSFMKKKTQTFKIGNIKYIFIRMAGMSLSSKIKKWIFGIKKQQIEDIEIIGNYINSIRPDIVHIIGAETSFYSESILKVPQNIPTIVQLQTLLADPDIAVHYPSIIKRIPSEKLVLERADYIGTTVKRFGTLVKQLIKKDAIILKTTLALTEPIKDDVIEKSFDFVYFAADINKACDLAIEGFALAKRVHPEITLDIIGFYDKRYKHKLDSRISELGITDSVFFEGKLQSHEEVMRQIRKSRFALIPTRTDIVCGTQREAMANGLPLVATITPGTPSLNEKRLSVLLSEVGDAEGMANNICKLLDDPSLADMLRKNAYITSGESQSNSQIINDWVTCYYYCIEHHKNNTPIPQEFLLDC